MRDDVAQAALAGRSALLVVPRDMDALRERGLLSAGTPVGVRVATLDGLLQAEWALAGDGRRPAQGLGRDVLLARALVEAGVTPRPARGAVALLGMLSARSTGPISRPAANRCLADRIIAAIAVYRASLTQYGLIEAGEMCEFLAAAPPPARLIAVSGFVELTPDHEALLLGWSAAGADVRLSLPWRPDCAGTSASEHSIRRLTAAGATVSQSQRLSDPRTPELQRLREGLLEGVEPGSPAGAVRMAVADGEEAEARHIASVAAGLIASGASPGSIVVAFADPSRHREWLRRAFEDHGVDADFDVSMDVGQTAFGAAVVQLRAYATGSLDTEGLAVLMRSRFSGVAIEQADASDAEWRGGVRPRGRSVPSQMRHLHVILGDRIGNAEAGIGTEEARRWKNLADVLLANAYPGAAPVTASDAALDASVHRTFCRQLREAVELGSGNVSAVEFWERFAATRVTAGARRVTDHILVTGIDEVPSEAFEHVIIGGLTAAEIPRRGSEDRLEGDAVASVMSRLGIAIDPEEHAREERRAFYLAAVTASASLTLTRQGTSDDGTPSRESVFWDEFLDLYRRPGEPLPTQEPLLLQTVTCGDGGLRGAPRIERGGALDVAAHEGLATITEVSPSQIETYVSCPYRWFIERRIGARAPDEVVDRAAAGRLAHDALARFYREWLDRAPRITRESRASAASLAADSVRAASVSLPVPETLEEMALLEAVGPSVLALVDRDADFLPDYAPTYLEWAFGGRSDLPAVEIGGVALKGRADRIDLGPEGLVVVDYKRSHASSLAGIRKDGLLQLQLYAVAASRVLGVPVAGGLYRSLKDGADRGFVLNGVSGAFKAKDLIERDELDALLESAIMTARIATDGMRAGRIEPTPTVDGCRYCAASGFCGRAVTA
jgi:RecB family exonuclease